MLHILGSMLWLYPQQDADTRAALDIAAILTAAMKVHYSNHLSMFPELVREDKMIDFVKLLKMRKACTKKLIRTIISHSSPLDLIEAISSLDKMGQDFNANLFFILSLPNRCPTQCANGIAILMELNLFIPENRTKLFDLFNCHERFERITYLFISEPIHLTLFTQPNLDQLHEARESVIFPEILKVLGKLFDLFNFVTQAHFDQLLGCKTVAQVNAIEQIVDDLFKAGTFDDKLPALFSIPSADQPNALTPC